MNHRRTAAGGLALAAGFLFALAGTAAGHSAFASCESITAINSPLNFTVYVAGTTTVVQGPQAGNHSYPIAPGSYDLKWTDGVVQTGLVVGACTQTTPTPTPTLTPPEVQLCDGPCPTPTPFTYNSPCTSNPAVIGPPCPDPTPTPAASPTPSPSPSSSPSPTPSEFVPPSATPTPPTIDLPETATAVTDSNTIAGLVFVIAALAGLLVALWPRRAR